MGVMEGPFDLLHMDLTQVNGQRKYGGPPPGWMGPPPPRGSEIFLKIPRDCFEDVLLPVLEKIGKVYEIRMMMDFSGSNRGYCFVTFANKNIAQKAVEVLDNFPLKPGRKVLGARLSVDNRKLFVGRIPCDKTKQEILIEMCKVTNDVKDVTVYKKIGDQTQNRSYAFVEYHSHKAAALARRALCSALLWGNNVIVDWAEPEPEVSEEKLANVKCLFVRNFSCQTTQNSLMGEFCRAMGNSDGIKSVKIVRDFAFVDFYTRDEALRAAAIMNGRMVDGFQLEVELAKPRCERNMYGMRQFNHQTPRAVYCLDLLEQVQHKNGIKSRPYEQSLRPEMVHDVRQVVSHWRRKFPDLSFISFLSDICMTEGWGQPDYFLKEIKHRVRHRKIKMFAYKVVIRGLAARQVEFVFDPVNFVEDRRLAKEYGAIFTLSRIRLSSIQGQPKKRCSEIQITAEDVMNFMSFMKSIPAFPPPVTGIMNGIDRELAQACALLSLSGSAQAMQSISYGSPNVSAEMVSVGLPSPQDAFPSIYNVSSNYTFGQIPVTHFPGMPTSLDAGAASGQLGFFSPGFPASEPDVSSTSSTDINSPPSADSSILSSNVSLNFPNVME